ncbi:14570_t:CDS:2, partial [Entrophospora sp. SA101]
MLERWSPQVFQYTLRGGNYGVYCLVASSMIHLVNMSSPDLRFSKPAHDNLLRTLNVLKICVDHSSARELRDKVHGLEVAFSAQQSLGLMFNGGVPEVLWKKYILEYNKGLWVTSVLWAIPFHGLYIFHEIICTKIPNNSIEVGMMSCCVPIMLKFKELIMERMIHLKEYITSVCTATPTEDKNMP